MNSPATHPDSGAPYQLVARAQDPWVKAHDLALLEFAGPEPERARAFFTAFGLQCSNGPQDSLHFAATPALR